jgi:hypothetical protein
VDIDLPVALAIFLFGNYISSNYILTDLNFVED